MRIYWRLGRRRRETFSRSVDDDDISTTMRNAMTRFEIADCPKGSKYSREKMREEWEVEQVEKREGIETRREGRWEAVRWIGQR